MRNPNFYVSGKRLIQFTLLLRQGLNPIAVTFDLRGPMMDSTHSVPDPYERVHRLSVGLTKFK